MTCKSFGDSLLHHIEGNLDSGKLLMKLAELLTELVFFFGDLAKFFMETKHALELLVI